MERLCFSRPAILTFNPFVAAFCPMKWASIHAFTHKMTGLKVRSMFICVQSTCRHMTLFRQARQNHMCLG